MTSLPRSIGKNIDWEIHSTTNTMFTLKIGVEKLNIAEIPGTI